MIIHVSKRCNTSQRRGRRTYVTWQFQHSMYPILPCTHADPQQRHTKGAYELALTLAASCRMLSLIPLCLGRDTRGLSPRPIRNTLGSLVAKVAPAQSVSTFHHLVTSPTVSSSDSARHQVHETRIFKMRPVISSFITGK